MRLVAVARAKLDEESATNGLVSKTQDFTLDFCVKARESVRELVTPKLAG
jgi:hypothetical protein